MNATIHSEKASYLSRLHPVGPARYNPADPAPWWNQLGEDFAASKERFELEPFENMQLKAVAMADHVFRTYISVMFSLGNIPHALKLLGKNYRDIWSFYDNDDFRQNPDLFFKRPDTLPDIQARPAKTFFQIKDAICEDLDFISPFQPVNPAMSALLVDTKHPDHASARWFRHKSDTKRPTVIIFHGFVVDQYDINSWLFDVKEFFERGYNVLLYKMPYHGDRRTPNARFSGDGFVTIDVAIINETMAHSIYDLRIFIEFLKSRGTSSIGATGISLGGYHTALLASLEKDLAFAVPLVPVISLIDLALEWQPMATLVGGLMNSFGHSVAEIRKLFALHTSLTYRPMIDRERMFIVAGIGDRMATPKQSRLLWEHWNHPDMHWFVGNHLIHLERSVFMDRLFQFLSHIDV